MFGAVSKKDCINEVFYGTDYHSHLGTEFGGMAVFNGNELNTFIRDILNHPFRSRLRDFIENIDCDRGIGVISDSEPQPLWFDSSSGAYALSHVGKITNLQELALKQSSKNMKVIYIKDKKTGAKVIHPIGLLSNLIGSGKNIVDGIEIAQNSIEGSSSMMLLNREGIYVARDKYGRTPLVIGEKEGAMAAASESCSFPNTGFKTSKFLGPGEIGILTEKGYEQIKKPGENMQICTFLWVYYGSPASSYEGKNVEIIRNRCGMALARRDRKEGLLVDIVAGVPDSGTPHAVGYAKESGVSFERPFVKYSDTWQRSFMPQEQVTRALVANMKLLPIPELIKDLKLLFCDDSVVRGTQLKKKIKELFHYGAKEVHLRPACPPLTFGCNYLNFSRPSRELDLAAKRAIAHLEELKTSSEVNMEHLTKYLQEDSESYHAMVKHIGEEIGVTSLRYQKLPDLVSAVGLPKGKLCTYCWDGCCGCK